MKLLFQADDFGLCESTACGILKGIREGVIRNTGLFVNMPASEYSAKLIKDVKNVCLGIDFKLVAGKPVSDPVLVPSLVDAKGDFIPSGERMKKMKSLSDTMRADFETDPYPYDETVLEIENQLKRFIELVGRKPGYLHGHSLITNNIVKAIQAMSEKYEIPVSFNVWKEKELYMLPCEWTPKPFPIEQQLATNVEANLMSVLPQVLDHELNVFVCHAGFAEEELFKYSSYTIIRLKDLAAATSPDVKKFIEMNQIELITYDDLKEN